MAIKNFILDTNVLLYDPEAFDKFQENNLIIPISVIEEIDKFKKDMTEVGRNARHVSRILDNMRKTGSLHKGIKLKTGGTLRIELSDQNTTELLPPDLKKTMMDNRIVSVALDVKKKTEAGRYKNRPTILVTKDTNLRIKADALGLEAEDYEHGKIEFDELYTGMREILVEPEIISAMFKSGASVDLGLLPNQYVILRNMMNPGHTAIGRFCGKTGYLVPVTDKKEIWSILPKNLEQHFAMDALLNDDIKLVTIVGKAGTGKTLLAIAAGLARTADENKFRKLLVSRPVFPMGKDIGFLPGDIEEKLGPWMQPIFDNIEFLLHTHEPDGRHSKSHKELQEMGILEIEPLTYIRGRSIPGQYMIVDEAQNLTPHEAKTIVTRAGEGTKIIMTGDPYQIDNPYVDASSNGLSYIIDRFKAEPIAAHITLSKGERSELAEVAANIL